MCEQHGLSPSPCPYPFPHIPAGVDPRWPAHPSTIRGERIRLNPSQSPCTKGRGCHNCHLEERSDEVSRLWVVRLRLPRPSTEGLAMTKIPLNLPLRKGEVFHNYPPEERSDEGSRLWVVRLRLPRPSTEGLAMTFSPSPCPIPFPLSQWE